MRAIPRAVQAAVALSAAALVILVLAGPTYRIGLFSVPTAFTMMAVGAWAGLAAAIVAALAGAWAYRKGQKTAALVAAGAFVAGLLAVGIPLNWQRLLRSSPPIYDISTDLENPPAFDAVLAVRGTEANPIERAPLVDQQQRESYPDIAPITVSRPLDEIFDRAIAVAQDNGWEIVTADKAAGRIEATDTTRWFGFKDDVVVRLTRWGSGTRIDVRSVSRTGGNDAGTNARRIRRFLGALQSG